MESPIINNTNAPQNAPLIDDKIKFKKLCVILSFVLLSIFILGLLYLSGIEPNPAGGVEHSYSMWLVIAYLAGLSMIFLPCTFPLVFVIVPLCLSRDYKKGLLMAVLFGLGLSITLSIYGLGIAFLGQRVGLDKATESILIFAGVAAYFLALSELGFIKFKIPTYSGQIPKFIQAQNDYLKTFFLGLFLGNAGVGCPNPWFYFMLAYIARSADINKGLTLGFVHGVGRAVPLILLAVLGLLGINYAKQILKNKEKVEKMLGWVLIFVAAFILANGVFSHEWYVQSGIHSFWERGVRVFLGEEFGERIEHVHEVVQSPFYTVGNYMLVVLFVLPMLWYFNRQYTANIKRRAGWEVVFKFIVVIIGMGALFILGDQFSKTDTAKNLLAILFSALGIVLFYYFTQTEHAILSGAQLITGQPSSAPAQVTEVEMRKKLKAIFKIIITTVILLLLFTQYFPASTPKHQMIMKDAGTERTITAQGMKIDFSIAPELPAVGQPVELKFVLKDEKTGQVVENLQISHTKPMHLILVSNDLDQFNHLHPVLVNKGYKVDHNFITGGNYKLWIDFKHHGIHRLISFEFSVTDSAPISEAKLAPRAISTVSGYTITLINSKKISANKMTDLKFEIKDAGGNVLTLDKLEDYLGAKAHFITISQDLKVFGHGHIEGRHGDDKHKDDHGFKIVDSVYANGAGHGDNTEHKNFISAHHTFQKAGLHKIWLEFQVAGKIVRADFVVNIEQ